MDITTLVLRTIFIYLCLLLLTRTMGKRAIGKLSSFDLMVAIMMGELAVLSVQRLDVPLVISLIPILVLFVSQITYNCIGQLSSKIRRWFEAPVASFEEKKLTSALSPSFRTVSFSEQYGSRKPLILVEDGQVNHHNLNHMGKNLLWLKRELKRRTGSSSLKRVALCSVDHSGYFFIDVAEERQK